MFESAIRSVKLYSRRPSREEDMTESVMMASNSVQRRYFIYTNGKTWFVLGSRLLPLEGGGLR